ncbi:MAG: aromatic-ring-hydroxylating dioxygenase subunit beta [Candidatus Parcubacteria bacterium]|nr:aromatic-ring-hydroxylating dioxygenase subunit beta [Burkholderiales bacterium]
MRKPSYVDDAFYRDLADGFTDWQLEERRISEPAPLESCRAFLHLEARLLDEGRFEDWLALFADECLFWVPGSPGGDPKSEIAMAFDDRRQLEGRIYRLRTGYAWSQVPQSRTSRIVSNVEAFRGASDAVCMLRSSFLITELRGGETRMFAGWNAHRLAREGRGWKILVKQMNLIDCDQNLRNPSLLL